jgi:hypothetical protein
VFRRTIRNDVLVHANLAVVDERERTVGDVPVDLAGAFAGAAFRAAGRQSVDNGLAVMTGHDEASGASKFAMGRYGLIDDPHYEAIPSPAP